MPSPLQWPGPATAQLPSASPVTSPRRPLQVSGVLQAHFSGDFNLDAVEAEPLLFLSIASEDDSYAAVESFDALKAQLEQALREYNEVQPQVPCATRRGWML